jgi:hypothetical protein
MNYKACTQEELKNTRERLALKQQKENAPVENLVEKFFEYFETTLGFAITKINNYGKTSAEVNVNLNANITSVDRQSMQLHHFLYGECVYRRNNIDNKTKPFANRYLFQEIQAVIFKNCGWYFIEESDESESDESERVLSRFMLYTEKPQNYGMKTLWHGHNVLQVDLEK